MADATQAGMTFGACLRSIRSERKISLRQLAREVQITPTYLSDLERGNNHPPDKELLKKLIFALDLQHDEEAWQTLLDLAAQERNDLPADIKDGLMNNRPLQMLIRKIQQTPDCEKLCTKLIHELSIN